MFTRNGIPVNQRTQAHIRLILKEVSWPDGLFGFKKTNKQKNLIKNMIEQKNGGEVGALGLCLHSVLLPPYFTILGPPYFMFFFLGVLNSGGPCPLFNILVGLSIDEAAISFYQ